MSTRDLSKDIGALVKRLRGEFPGVSAAPSAPPENGDATAAATAAPTDPEPDQPILCEFVRSMLLWESTTAKAAVAQARICESVVDLNEFRVCLPNELVKIMGERYPRVEERALRLRAALNHLFVREHGLTLEHLAQMGKREAKEYLDTLDGVPRFVSARVMLLRLGGHHAPVDGRILKRLIEGKLAEPDSTPDAAAALLEKSVKAGEMLELYQLLRAWADQAPVAGVDGVHTADEGRARKPGKHAEPGKPVDGTKTAGKRRAPSSGKGSGKDAGKK